MSVIISEFIKPVLNFEKKSGFFPLVLFIIALLYLVILQSPPTMLDPDGFYHAKMAVLTWENFSVNSFSWLPLTTLNTYWVDQHWLYHLMLAPATQITDPLWAAKILAVILGVVFVMVFYWFLADIINNRRRAFWWSMLLLGSAPLVFRLTLVKAQPLALIFFILVFWTIYKRRFWLFAFLQFFYVLAHGSFILVPALLAWSILILILYSPARQIFNLKENFIFLEISIGMIILAILSQPTFPNNIIFYWYQIFNIALFKVEELATTGTEWSALTPLGWFKALGPLIFIVIINVFFAVRYWSRINPRTKWWLFMLIPLIVLSSRSIRNFEFFVPILIVFFAFLWQDTVKFFNLDSLVRKTGDFIQHCPFVLVFVLFPLIWFLYPMVGIFSYQESAFPLTYMKEPAEWLIGHTKPGELVINARWDTFPALFYHNSHNHYLSGLDPAFLYLANPSLYKEMVSLRQDGNYRDVRDDLRQYIGEEYRILFLTDLLEDGARQKLLDSNLILQYENENVLIYSPIL